MYWFIYMYVRYYFCLVREFSNGEISVWTLILFGLQVIFVFYVTWVGLVVSII